MENKPEISPIEIRNLIYSIRGKQVMLDSSLASLYQVETKNLNKAVKRNVERFPACFSFQLVAVEQKIQFFIKPELKEEPAYQIQKHTETPSISTYQLLCNL